MAGSHIGLGAAGVLICLSAPAHAAGQTVRWEIEDRFRLFGEADPAAREKVRDLLGQLDVRLDERHGPILEALSGPDAATLRRSHYRPTDRVTPGGSGRYDRAYLYPDHYTILVRLEGARPGAQCL